jgi:hypothetical protein
MELNTDYPWDILQQSTRPAPGLETRYLILLDAVFDLGWKVIEPIYLRPRWGEDGPWDYHLILQHGNSAQQCLITAPADMQMNCLVKFEGWRVDRPAQAKIVTIGCENDGGLVL